MSNDFQRNAYQITINNPVENGFPQEAIKKTLVENFATLEYFCLGDEIGEQGTYHTHVYVYFSSRVRFSTLKKRFPTAHIEAASGSHQQNREYIRKEGKWKDTDKAETTVPDTFFEWGDMPTSRGTDKLMGELYELVQSGYSDGEIIEFNHDYIRNIDTIAKLRKTILIDRYKGQRRTDLKVHYIFGATGTGKTRSVLDAEGDGNVYRVTDYEHPFDSYNMQSVLCLDEFRSSLKITFMLDALDIYPLELPARYSNRCACYITVYIISNWRLEDQYPEIQENQPTTWQAFLRRIHTVTEYLKDGTIKKYDSVREYLDRDKAPVQLTLSGKPLDYKQGEVETMSEQDIPF